jgi:hypothetical protein
LQGDRIPRYSPLERGVPKGRGVLLLRGDFIITQVVSRYLAGRSVYDKNPKEILIKDVIPLKLNHFDFGAKFSLH